MCQNFKDLKQTFTVSLRAEKLRLRVQQRVVATVEDSVLHTEMVSLESQEEDTPRRVLWFKPVRHDAHVRISGVNIHFPVDLRLVVDECTDS